MMGRQLQYGDDDNDEAPLPNKGEKIAEISIFCAEKPGLN